MCGLTDVARINLAGTGPTLSRCSRLTASFRLKLSLKLWCLRNFPCSGESKLNVSIPASDNVRGVIGGGCGDNGAPAG